MFDLNKIIRENIKSLKPYSSARDEYKGKTGIFLDANENSFCKGYNRYPDPLQLKLKEKISAPKNIPLQNIFLGNGSDEAIDILFRAFCDPGMDNVIICPPTYGMYEVSANINNVNITKVPLTSEEFQLDTGNILRSINKNTKLTFVCCPNNPTGNGVKWNDIKLILENFNGLVVVDEAYIDFASYNSLISKLDEYPNLVILQTFSKAWGMAGLRIGMAFASTEIIEVFNNIKPPYNINAVSQEMVLKALDKESEVKEFIRQIKSERERLRIDLKTLQIVLKIYPSEANFLLIKTTDPKKIYNYLVSKQIIVRDRSKIELCGGCLRITIGTKEENELLLNTLKQYK
ncbi:MAG TPA: histidinol-phosphate transaminase [Bacteroidia bacterium]|jgi:histidinol-phosphate aminotransferase|nr:histidinol-phosphate transaminase [Bacteroidia bacterium]